MRIPSWILGVEGFLNHPVVGIGPKMNEFVLGLETSENLFLDVAIMTGVLGTFMNLWLLWKLLHLVRQSSVATAQPFLSAFLKGYKAILVTLFVVSLTGSVLFNLKIMMLFWLLTAFLWSLTRSNKQGRP
jgi:hypothetical protein